MAKTDTKPADAGETNAPNDAASGDAGATADQGDTKTLDDEADSEVASGDETVDAVVTANKTVTLDELRGLVPEDHAPIINFAPGHPQYAYGKLYVLPVDEAESLVGASKARVATPAETAAHYGVTLQQGA